MTILLFGATGSAGGSVLRLCLAAPEVQEVRAVVRRTTGLRDPKLHEIVHTDYMDYAAIAKAFAGVDACFFCLGISVRLAPDEAEYRRIHRDFPMAAAAMLRAHSPGAQFHYLSGGRAALDSRWMWARVKAEAERDLISEYGAMCWRPAAIDGMPPSNEGVLVGVARRSLTALLKPFRGLYVKGEDIGRAMLQATRQDLRGRIVENGELRDFADRWQGRRV